MVVSMYGRWALCGSSLYRSMTRSASCSMAPDSRKSLRRGCAAAVVVLRFSTSRDSCASAIMGICKSLASPLSSREILLISCSRLWTLRMSCAWINCR